MQIVENLSKASSVAASRLFASVAVLYLHLLPVCICRPMFVRTCVNRGLAPARGSWKLQIPAKIQNADNGRDLQSSREGLVGFEKELLSV